MSADRTGGHPRGARLHQNPKDIESGFLCKSREGGDGRQFFHHSIVLDASKIVNKIIHEATRRQCLRVGVDTVYMNLLPAENCQAPLGDRLVQAALDERPSVQPC